MTVLLPDDNPSICKKCRHRRRTHMEWGYWQCAKNARVVARNFVTDEPVDPPEEIVDEYCCNHNRYGKCEAYEPGDEDYPVARGSR